MSLLLSVGISNSAIADVSIVGSWEITEETGTLFLLRDFTENKIPNFKIIPSYYKVL